MKDIHLNLNETVFKCVTCQKEYPVLTTFKTPDMAVEVCSNCHSFYIGKQNATTALRGRAEKLNSKFQTAKENMQNKPVKKTVTKKPKARPASGFDVLGNN
ncbi:50S ribosomal protein L31 [Ureaplasma zalophigenitalium]|uniref:50S ribosomal protein L31 n=1 Tax=Ureaplasma zalophigenitalium TaxID=907723 RepID=A0ABT3BPZ9_9BACT|nr:50S ribosomal protein L31 [Ureaplasma zalophigenitalium]MCV3754320.1 50S ribosomal protein L31 [Ureaplasma zalophigenitalium]